MSVLSNSDPVRKETVWHDKINLCFQKEILKRLTGVVCSNFFEEQRSNRFCLFFLATETRR